MRSACFRLRWVAVVVAANVLALGGIAQTVANQGERYRIETTAAADGTQDVTITNLSGVPMTAFRATYRCEGQAAPSNFVEDTVIMGMGTPQPEKKSLTFAVPRKDCSGGVSVLAFADGQHVGDALAWRQVVVQRSAAYAEVSGLLSVAEGMSQKDWKLPDFLAEVGKRKTALAGLQAMTVDERRGRLMVLGLALEGFGAEKGPSLRVATIAKLIRWMSALGDALGTERVEFSAAGGR